MEKWVIFGKLKIIMQWTANENAACLRRICKRSDRPKIERLVNNDARLILRRKLNRATTIGKIGHTWVHLSHLKNGSHNHIWKNGSHLEKYVTFGKMCHILKNG